MAPESGDQPLFDVLSVPRDKVIAMLKLEQEVRYSKEWEELYDFVLSDPSYPETLPERKAQQLVLKKFGFDTSLDSLQGYWKIRSKYEHDDEVMNSAFYLKYNIMKRGHIREGDDMTDVEVRTEDGEPVLLSSFVSSKPTVILAGSIT
mmetsp:Transcript_6901/g.17445  ORF Transcript_6901/g.17445 Transcript_6901/m.17445 type:complete len:148 (-) Transcript_6901:1470-1913(-)